MPNLSVAIPHRLSRAEAKKRIQALTTDFHQQYGGKLGRLEERWNGDTLDFTVFAMGHSITGQAFVEDQIVRLEVALPWLLAMLAGPVKEQLESEGRRLLGDS